MPIALAPGMGINAYFTYQVVGFHGTGSVSYPLALTAVFVEGWIFVALSLLGLRQWLARALPKSIKIATAAGIGLYLTIIGLSPGGGLNVITGSSATPLELGGCPAEYRDEFGQCTSHKLQLGTMWIGIFCGGFVTAFLMMYRVKGAIIVGILFVSIISWPRVSTVTAFPYTPLGDAAFDFFKQVVAFHPISDGALVAQNWDIGSTSSGGQFALALITFLYVDILDVTGTLYSMARFCGALDEKTGDFEGSAVAYIVDAVSISIGSLFGTSPVTAFIESGAGISEGGKTGITAMVTGFAFFISVFFAPIFASIPTWATGSALVLIGCMMMASVKDMYLNDSNWNYPGDAIPAFLTIALMPFTYSIAYGLIAGIVSYMVLNTFVYILKVVSKGRIIPPNYDEKDEWTWRVEGGLLPPW
jgi:AGZA family xanthine/uracil permease-like MFS transporter